MTAIPSPGIVRPLARGDIVLVPFPFADLSTTKRRPALIVHTDSAQNELTLAFIGTQHVSAVSVGEVAIPASHSEFGLTGLSAASKVRATKVITLSRTLITRRLGYLGPLLTADVNFALVNGLGIDTMPYFEAGRNEERARLISLYAATNVAALLTDLGLVGP